MARAIDAGELTKLRSNGQASKIYLAIHNPAVVLACRANQTFPNLDGVSQITFDGVTAGAYGSVLAGMTLWVGSAAGLYDKGRARIRAAATSTILYIGLTSEIAFADDDYLTVVNEFGIWPKIPTALGDEVLIDYNLAYTDQHDDLNPAALLGPAAAVLWLTGATVNFSPDASASWVLGSTISTYAWSAPGASATSDLDTATPTITYNAAGTYRVSCVVTAANGKATTGYRIVFVYSAAAMPVTQFEFNKCNGDVDAGGWSFDVKMHAEAGITTVRDQALVVLFAEDWYGGVKGSIGPVTGYENIIAIGWIDGETIQMEPQKNRIGFGVKGPQFWLQESESFPFQMEDTSTTATEWFEMPGNTVDKMLVHFIHWRSTLGAVLDVFLSGNTTELPTENVNADSMWSQIEQIAGLIKARPLCDRYGRLVVEVDTNLVESGDRSGIAVVQAITSADWTEIEIERRNGKQVSMLEVSGIQGSDSMALMSRAPGVIYGRKGKSLGIDNLLFDDQTEANALCGNMLAWENNEWPAIDIVMAANNRFVDICPRQRLTMSLAAGDTARGITWTDKPILARRVEILQGENGNLYTRIEAEAETSGAPGWTVIVPPESLIGNTEIEIPDFEDISWPALTPIGTITPEYIPVEPQIPPGDGECPTNAPANGPYPLYIYGEISSATVASRDGLIRCIIRTSGHDNKTTYQIHGRFQKLVSGSETVYEDTLDDSFYSVYAYNSAGTLIATGVHDAVTDPFVRTGVLNAVAASEISRIVISLAETELLRPSDMSISVPEEYDELGVLTHGNYGFGVWGQHLGCYNQGSTIWTGANVDMQPGIKLGDDHDYDGDTFRIRQRAWVRGMATLAGGSGLYLTKVQGGQWSNPLSGAQVVWTYNIGAYDNNNTLYDTGWREYTVTIPGGLNPAATLFIYIDANVNGQTDLYKLELVEHLLYAWIASSYRIIIGQANIWNVCPPEAL